ncbi:hypothetical protein HLH89_33270 [Rhizobium laguerreae]|nr:hypothetical protein [Rhizobium laguerreae]
MALSLIRLLPFLPLGGSNPLQSATLSEVTRRLEATPIQGALAWLLQWSRNILLIPGTSSVAHLRENVAAASLSCRKTLSRSSMGSRWCFRPAGEGKQKSKRRELASERGRICKMRDVRHQQ